MKVNIYKKEPKYVTKINSQLMNVLRNGCYRDSNITIISSLTSLYCEIRESISRNDYRYIGGMPTTETVMKSISGYEKITDKYIERKVVDEIDKIFIDGHGVCKISHKEFGLDKYGVYCDLYLDTKTSYEPSNDELTETIKKLYNMTLIEIEGLYTGVTCELKSEPKGLFQKIIAKFKNTY